MEREYLDFNILNPLEKEWFLSETWCDFCGEADLGIEDPIYYRENGRAFIAGNCKVCGQLQATEVIVKRNFPPQLNASFDLFP